MKRYDGIYQKELINESSEVTGYKVKNIKISCISQNWQWTFRNLNENNTI